MTPEQAGFFAGLDGEAVGRFERFDASDRRSFLDRVRHRASDPEQAARLRSLLARPPWLDEVPPDLAAEFDGASLIDLTVLAAVAEACNAHREELLEEVESRLRWIAYRRRAAEPDPDSPGLTRGQAEFLRSLDADSRARLDSLPPRERRRIVDDFTHGDDPEIGLREDAIRRIRRKSSSVRLPKPPRGGKWMMR